MTVGEAGGRAGVLVACGARACEALLLDEVERLAAQARAEPRLLALPVRIVVPSQSLREHLCAALVRRAGAVAGVVLQTLHGLAMEVLDAAGEAPRRGDALFPVLVRRRARAHPLLREALEPLRDGYAVVAGDVADLLDAGFDPDAHGEALAERLGPLGPGLAERARAVVEVAADTARRLAELGCGRRGTRLAQARARLAADPQALPARAVLIHGFADATGVAADLLELLVRRGARVLVDRPPDPAEPGGEDPGVAFTERLLARLAAAGGCERAGGAPPPPRLSAIAAPGAHAEVRAVAARIRRLLTAGVAPEDVGIVARDLASYALPLRLHLGRLGIPFSGQAALAPPGGAGRRVHGLLALLRDGGRAPAERWLDVRAGLSPGARADLRLGLHALGAGRLADVARLDVAARLADDPVLPLPARRGLELVEAEGAAAPRARRRGLGRRALEEAVAAAGRLLERLERWPDPGPLAAHAAALDELAGGELGWEPARRERAALAEALRGLGAELPADHGVGRDEVVLLLGRALRDVGCVPVGGAGAGVQVLGVVEARARTFEHLFLLGMNRDAFPRPVLEDPLLPDEARRRLAEWLPAMPIKARAVDEERYLFAQLLSASPRVTLSWQVVDDDGKARPPSPLIERLRIAGRELPIETAPSLHARPGAEGAADWTAAEAALLEGLHGSRAGFAELLPVALGEAAAAIGGGADAACWARGRLAVLWELDHDAATARRPGPYFGFVGEASLPSDLRRAPLSVTQIEDAARCPWRAFVGRLLRIEPPPDALDALPAVTPLLLGNLVHGVLEVIVRDALRDPPGELEAARAREPRAVPWPEDAELRGRIAACAEALLREQGIALPGFARLLVERALPLVQAARWQDWPAPGSAVGALGVEVLGEAELAVAGGRLRRIHFRADRVDLVAGRLRLVDYKTGRPLATQKKAERRRAAFVERVAQGTALQAVAYAQGKDREGRYVFLAQGDDPAAVLAAGADDGELREAFAAAVGAVLEVFDRGAFFPRLVVPDGSTAPSACGWCDVRDGCLQGDSGARARLHRFAAGEGEEGGAAERALRALWPRGGDSR